MQTLAAVGLVVVLTLMGAPLALWRLTAAVGRRVGTGLGGLAERAAGTPGRRGVQVAVDIGLGKLRLPLGVAILVLGLLAALLAMGSGWRTGTLIALLVGGAGLVVVMRLITAVAGRLPLPGRRGGARDVTGPPPTRRRG